MISTARHIRIFAVAANIGVAALLCLASCGRSKTAAELERISLLTEEYPDSALQLLLATDTAAFADRADRARFAVALTNASYLAYDPDCNDSLLSLQADYFADAPADRFKMLYLYLSATFKIERKLFTEAITQLFDAAQIAEASADHLYAGRIYRAISDIYINMLNSSQSLKYGMSALENFEKYGNQRLINWQLIRVGQAYFNNGKYDESIIVLQKTHENAIESSDNELLSQTKELLARDYMEKGEYRKAIDLLQNLDKDYLVFDYFTLSNSYLNIDNIDSAKYYNDRLMDLDANNREMSFKINKKLGNKDLAIDDLEKEFNRQTDYYFNLAGENFLGIETNYFTDLAAKNKTELINTKRILTYSTILFCALIVLSYLNYRRLLRKRKKQVSSYYRLTETLKQQLDESITSNDNNYEILKKDKQKLDSERRKIAKDLLIAQTKYERAILLSTKEVESLNKKIETLKNQLTDIELKYNNVKQSLETTKLTQNDIVNNILRNEVGKRFDVLNKLCEVLYIADDNFEQINKDVRKQIPDYKENKLLKRISNIINDFKFSESAYKELEEIVDKGYDGIITEFKTSLPELYKTYGSLYLYKCLSLPVMTIAYLLGTTEKSVYGRTYQLKIKINKLAKSKKDELLKPIS